MEILNDIFKQMLVFDFFGAGAYQHLPEKTDPIAFGSGFFSVTWYALMYIAAFFTIYTLLLHRIKRNEFPNGLQIVNCELQKNIVFSLLVCSFIGLLIGARLGYVLFYDFSFYLNNPSAIISPFDVDGNFIGIYGMSFYGGLIGVLIAGYIFCRKKKINFFKLADFVVPAIPAGYFFGRIGNFLNGELYGRVTEKPWGMYFSDGLLRHPSQLYEAFFEGLVLFAILWALRNKKSSQMSIVNGQMLFMYLFLYAFFRFFIEFFREPDLQIGLIFGLTLGQIFSLAAIFIAVDIFVCRKYKKVA